VQQQLVRDESKPGKERPVKKAPSGPPIIPGKKGTIQELWGEYGSNAIAADGKYKDKLVQVRGGIRVMIVADAALSACPSLRQSIAVMAR
jgi:hypothetical protein